MKSPFLNRTGRRTFDDPLFRTILLRGMAWAAGEPPRRFDHLVLRGIPLKG